MKLYLNVPVLLVSIFALASCEFLKSSEQKAEIKKYEEARDLWESKNTSGSYQFKVTKLCYCGVTGEVEVFVSNNEITQVISVESGEMAALDFYSTIVGEFDWIETKLNRDPYPDKLEVEYNSEFGFPVSMEYDGSKNSSDDEYTLEIRDVSF